jgi:hypothetical protein
MEEREGGSIITLALLLVPCLGAGSHEGRRMQIPGAIIILSWVILCVRVGFPGTLVNLRVIEPVVGQDGF